MTQHSRHVYLDVAVMFLRPPAHAPTVHMLQDRFFSRRPNGRLGLAQEETPSLVTEEAANDSSSKPIRVLPNSKIHTYLSSTRLKIKEAPGTVRVLGERRVETLTEPAAPVRPREVVPLCGGRRVGTTASLEARVGFARGEDGPVEAAGTGGQARLRGRPEGLAYMAGLSPAPPDHVLAGALKADRVGLELLKDARVGRLGGWGVGGLGA